MWGPPGKGIWSLHHPRPHQQKKPDSRIDKKHWHPVPRLVAQHIETDIGRGVSRDQPNLCTSKHSAGIAWCVICELKRSSNGFTQYSAVWFHASVVILPAVPIKISFVGTSSQGARTWIHFVLAQTPSTCWLAPQLSSFWNSGPAQRLMLRG